jgi:hypothetical protein
MMTGYVGPIESQTLKNTYFRQVLFTGKHAQLVVMCLQPGEEIGKEVHPDVDQFFRIERVRRSSSSTRRRNIWCAMRTPSSSPQAPTITSSMRRRRRP